MKNHKRRIAATPTAMEKMRQISNGNRNFTWRGSLGFVKFMQFSRIIAKVAMNFIDGSNNEQNSWAQMVKTVICSS